jgi:hypothetical protein
VDQTDVSGGVIGEAWGARFGWDVHLSDSRLAFGWDGFRFSGLQVIETKGRRKLKVAKWQPDSTILWGGPPGPRGTPASRFFLSTGISIVQGARRPTRASAAVQGGPHHH